MKKLLGLLLALVMLLSFAACANDDDTPPANEDGQQEEQNGSEAGTMNKLADIKAAGELVVGTSADYPPYEFHMEIDGVDTIVGFDIAIAQAFADELGVELKLVDMVLESLLISLQKGDFDLVMAGLTPDEERAKTVDFTDVFFHNKQIVIIRAEDADKYVTTEDMAGTTLGVQAGTVQETIAADLTDENKVVKLKKFPELIMELKTAASEVDLIPGAEGALKQIHDRRYYAGMKGRVQLIGISFWGKVPCVRTDAVNPRPFKESL